MKTRWQFILGLFGVGAAAQSVIITPGPSIFGPPLPVPPPVAELRNGQCPRCGHQLAKFTANDMDVMAKHHWAIRSVNNTIVQLLRDCPQCRTAFWQSGDQ